jgi:hypothetical protein
MHLLAYWKWENYLNDIAEETRADGYHYNSNQKHFHPAIEVGERLWLVSQRNTPAQTRWILVGCLTVGRKTLNPPGYKYGRFRIQSDVAQSAYYSPDGPDMTDLLRRLDFYSPQRDSPKPIGPTASIGQSLQTIRRLSPGDDALLRAWSQGLDVLHLSA